MDPRLYESISVLDNTAIGNPLVTFKMAKRSVEYRLRLRPIVLTRCSGENFDPFKPWRSFCQTFHQSATDDRCPAAGFILAYYTVNDQTMSTYLFGGTSISI